MMGLCSVMQIGMLPRISATPIIGVFSTQANPIAPKVGTCHNQAQDWLVEENAAYDFYG